MESDEEKKVRAMYIMAAVIAEDLGQKGKIEISITGVKEDYRILITYLKKHSTGFTLHAHRKPADYQFILREKMQQLISQNKEKQGSSLFGI